MERPLSLELILQEQCLEYFRKFPEEKHPFEFYRIDAATGSIAPETSKYCTAKEAEAIIAELLDKNGTINSSVYGYTWAMRTKGVRLEHYDTLANVYPCREEQQQIKKL